MMRCNACGYTDREEVFVDEPDGIYCPACNSPETTDIDEPEVIQLLASFGGRPEESQ